MNQVSILSKGNENKKGLWCNKVTFLFSFLFCFIGLFFIVNPTWADKKKPIEKFLNNHFISDLPSPQRIWINKDKQNEIKTQINPNQIKLSYRYWHSNNKTVWILDELGKERDITTGIVVENNKIQNVEVLIYRESRGGQVQNSRFTQQYNQKDEQSNLIKEIDSISGATLSVNALNKQVNLALLLNKYRIDTETQVAEINP